MDRKKRFIGQRKFTVRLGTKVVGETYHPVYEDRIAQVYVEIDVDAIMDYLGKKAIGNKSKRATEIGGLVIVKVSREIKA
jgi:hypothetical protein